MSVTLDVSGSATISQNLTVNSNALFVNSSNNRVGIGTLVPSATFDVSGDVRTRELNVNGNILLGNSGTSARATLTYGSSTNRTYNFPTGSPIGSTTDVVITDGSQTINGAKTFTTNIIGNLTGTATNSTNAVVTADSSNLNYFVPFVGGTSGNRPLLANTNITYNPSTSVLEADSFMGAISDVNYRRIFNPTGGSYNAGVSSVTGALRIQLPVFRSGSMFKMKIEVYNYTSQQRSMTIYCGAYLYAPNPPTQIINPVAYIIANPNEDRNLAVRFATDETAQKQYILIGETTTVWSYPNFHVTEVQVGFGGFVRNWTFGWVCDTTADLSGLTIHHTLTNCQIGYQSSSNTANSVVLRDGTGNFSAGTITASLSGNSTTATTLQTARTLWGQSFNGSANVTGNLTSVGNITGTGAITMTAGGTNQNITLTPSGTGTVNAPTFNATSVTGGGFQGIDVDTSSQPSFTWTNDISTGIFHPVVNSVGISTRGIERLRVDNNVTNIYQDLFLYNQDSLEFYMEAKQSSGNSNIYRNEIVQYNGQNVNYLTQISPNSYDFIFNHPIYYTNKNGSTTFFINFNTGFDNGFNQTTVMQLNGRAKLYLKEDSQIILGGQDDAGTTWNSPVLRATDMTFGTNLVGRNLTIASGMGRGTGGSGSIFFNTGSPGVTGTVLNTPSTRMTITNTGNVGIDTTAPNTLLDLGNSFFSGSPATLNQAINKLALWSSGTTINYGLGISTSLLNIVAGESTGSMAFRTGGVTERMRINNLGNVGIGTTAPAYPLDVSGSAKFTTIRDGANSVGTSGQVLSSTATGTSWINQSAITAGSATTATNANNIAVTDTTTTNATFYPTFTSGTTGNQVLRTDSATLTFNPSTNTLSSGTFAGNITSVATITGTGAITMTAGGTNQSITLTPSGTGTVNAPTFNATSTTNGGFQGIDADTAAAPSFTWSADLNTGVYHPAADTVGITTNGTEKMRINNLGNVGIGTTSPAYPLDVSGSAKFTTIRDGANAIGTSGQILSSTGSGLSWITNTAGGSVTYNAFTANGTYTVPANLKALYVICIGAGGGGCGGGYTGTGGTGGGGGGISEMWINGSGITAGSSITYVVGAGGGGSAGTPSTSTPANATAGGQTTFGTYCYAGGGGGGTAATGGGAGGLGNVCTGANGGGTSGGNGTAPSTSKMFGTSGGGGGGGGAGLAGGAGGTYNIGNFGRNATYAGGTSGAGTGGTPGGTGGNGFGAVGNTIGVSTGGGGGGGSSSTGGNGGNGGFYGSGGGGGGCTSTLSGPSGGTGGSGRAGIIYLWAYT